MKTEEEETTFYMNPETGSVDTYSGWEYLSESGETLNAVDLKEVVKVKRGADGAWVEDA